MIEDLMTGWLLWLATYFLHAAVWTAASAVLVRWVKLAPRNQNVAWRAALLGPVITSLLAIAVPLSVERALGNLSPFLRDTVASSFTLAESGFAHLASDSGTRAGTQGGWFRGLPWVDIFAVGSAAAALLGLLRFSGLALSFKRTLHTRVRAFDARATARLERLRTKARVRRVVLTECDGIDSPLVIARGEICVPSGLFERLADDELDGVLAHELAHLERSDGVGFFLAGAVQSALWMQPLNHWVAARLRRSAELASDDRAVELTRDPRGLLRALARVATDLSIHREAHIPVPTMVRSRSSLLVRLERLAVDSPARFEPYAQPREGWIILALLSLLALVTPNVKVRIARTMASSIARMVQGPAPNAALASEQVAELLRREQGLAAQVAAAELVEQADVSTSPAGMRLFELGQELRHTRAMRAFLEQRFIDESSSHSPAVDPPMLGQVRP